MSTLEITAGPAAGRTMELEGEVVIGREEATLVIEDPELSRRHARVCPVEGGVLVEDLGSTNGTFVNGERANGPVTLRSSGTVHLGTTDMEITIPPAVEATRVRQVEDFSPDLTVARQIPSDPDMTKARPIAEPGPDVTAPRRVAAAGPPPPGPPAPGPPPPGPAAPAAPARSGGPPAVVLAIAAVAIVAIVVVLLILLVL
jgi:hypothetical protein